MRRLLVALALLAASAAQADPNVLTQDAYPNTAPNQPTGAYLKVDEAKTLPCALVVLKAGTKDAKCEVGVLGPGTFILQMVNTRDGVEVAGDRYVMKASLPYSCQKYLTTRVCNVSYAALVKVPPVVAPPVVPPVVVPPVTPPTATTWEYGTTENQPFTLATSRVVRFGRNDTWIEKTLAAGTYTCGLALFGSDPVPGQGKYCELGAP